MVLVCKSCGAENAVDAASCWKCEAAGEALRGKRKTPAFAWLFLVFVVAGAIGAGAWWAVLREGAPYAGLLDFDGVTAGPAAASPSPTPSGAPSPAPSPGPTPATPATPTPTGAEAALLADPIDGPFFREFRDALPGDYSAVMGYLLTQVPDATRDMQRFDTLLGERLGVMRFANGADIRSADDSVLDEMADNMLRAMRAPEYCQAAIDPTMGGLDVGNTATRRLATAMNASIVRAIASGRKARVSRAEPTPEQVSAFNTALEDKLYGRHWQAYLSGQMEMLPPDEQCTIYVAYWTVIADYPPALSAIWTAQQMAQPAQ